MCHRQNLDIDWMEWRRSINRKHRANGAISCVHPFRRILVYLKFSREFRMNVSSQWELWEKKLTLYWWWQNNALMIRLTRYFSLRRLTVLNIHNFNNNVRHIEMSSSVFSTHLWRHKSADWNSLNIWNRNCVNENTNQKSYSWYFFGPRTWIYWGDKGNTTQTAGEMFFFKLNFIMCELNPALIALTLRARFKNNIHIKSKIIIFFRCLKWDSTKYITSCVLFWQSDKYHKAN